MSTPTRPPLTRLKRSVGGKVTPESGPFRALRAASCPAQQPGAGIDPAVLRVICADAGDAEAEKAEDQADDGVHQRRTAARAACRRTARNG